MPPLVIAHRGASGTCPENTLVAFARAAALGAHMIELDVQLTRDGEVVVMHDWTLERTTDGAGAVSDRTLAVLWDEGPVADAVARAQRVGARALHLRKDRTSPDALAAAAAAGLPVRAWTVNERGEMDRLVAAGVEGIFTDFPERFLHSGGDQ